ncbi:MAG: GTP cyclohydrolase I FolE [Nannocystaceae bacterium]|nr:GTP cyclohydrolase I FolE [Myxococcales bacterium]
MNTTEIERLIRALLTTFGEDTAREGLQATPTRVANTYEKLLEGYRRSFSEELTTFDNVHGYTDLITSGRIDFVSLCEHHLLPFYGHAHIAYVPDEKIIGLSKLARLVDIYSRRLQDQERITVQIADELMASLQPRGVCVLMTARHMCNIARGVEKQSSYMMTVTYRGICREDYRLQQQFLDFVKISRDVAD